MEVLNLIDDGKNLDEFTRDMLNGCIAKNQITKGKTDTFKAVDDEKMEGVGPRWRDFGSGSRKVAEFSGFRLGTGTGRGRRF
ncbi:hypothetical protein CASFOL_000210 [Castilleja foliolosa]|uniref:Mediator of RNA polymerase II transcription subunit 10 n=1 Tax=Castilleja foliolosa TaxID=1961234 RepID=A0ABD3ENL8_9LAMI